MVQFRPQAREVIAKVVYYGPPLGGKTTNLRSLYKGYPEQTRGELVVVPAGGDRTIFFDFLPVDAGTLRGMRLRVQLYTVPGQVHYNATRQIVLRGVDAVVFVADSQPECERTNKDSWENLKENLLLQGIALADIAHVLQYNKRDLPDALPIEQLDEALNQYNAPFFEAVASEGIGVEETLQGIVRLLARSLRDRFKTGEPSLESFAAASESPVSAKPAPPTTGSIKLGDLDAIVGLVGAPPPKPPPPQPQPAPRPAVVQPPSQPATATWPSTAAATAPAILEELAPTEFESIPIEPLSDADELHAPLGSSASAPLPPIHGASAAQKVDDPSLFETAEEVAPVDVFAPSYPEYGPEEDTHKVVVSAYKPPAEAAPADPFGDPFGLDEPSAPAPTPVVSAAVPAREPAFDDVFALPEPPKPKSPPAVAVKLGANRVSGAQPTAAAFADAEEHGLAETPTVAIQRVTPRALAQLGEVRELEVEVPVPAAWTGGRRMTLQLRLTLVPQEDGDVQ
jgi:signal recognition particle receptor subunit beta